MGYCKLDCPDGKTECCICCTKQDFCQCRCDERTFKNMNREEQICETCKENDNGFCDRIGRMVEDDDWCAKWKTKEVPEWKARMMNTFLAGH